MSKCICMMPNGDPLVKGLLHSTTRGQIVHTFKFRIHCNRNQGCITSWHNDAISAFFLSLVYLAKCMTKQSVYIATQLDAKNWPLEISLFVISTWFLSTCVVITKSVINIKYYWNMHFLVSQLYNGLQRYVCYT